MSAESDVRIRASSAAERSVAELTFLLPVYNEEEAIGAVLRELLSLAADRYPGSEVLVVDDGSVDETISRARQVQGVRVLRHKSNRGYGAALKTGIRHAQNNLIVILDGDGTYSPSDAELLIDAYERGSADMIVGARTGSHAAIPLMRRPAKWGLNRLSAYVAGEPIPDANSGLRLFRTGLVEKFIPLLPDGFSFTTTLTLALITHGYLVEYVQISYADRQGKSKIRPIADTFGFLQLIVRLGLFFAPLRVFLPISGLLLLLATAWAFVSWQFLGRVADASTAVVLVAAIQVAVLSLLAELINGRLPRHDAQADVARREED